MYMVVDQVMVEDVYGKWLIMNESRKFSCATDGLEYRPSNPASHKKCHILSMMYRYDISDGTVWGGVHSQGRVRRDLASS